MNETLTQIKSFLLTPTPEAWITHALQHQDILLIDHAHCEKKAAFNALNLIYKYSANTDLLQKLSRIAREELRHFEQVLKLCEKRNIKYQKLSGSRYASGLLEHIRKQEPGRLVDFMIIGAFIEARSCERFAAIAEFLDEELKDFYISLLKSEGRHYQVYLSFAAKYSNEDISERIKFFAGIEAELIAGPDEQFRFHSGVPVN